MIEVDPTERIHGPKVEKKLPEVLTMEEVVEFLKLPDTSRPKGLRDKAMFELMYATGMKVSELIHLKCSDINLKYSILECHSEKKQRIIPFGKTALQALNRYLEYGRPYFSGKDKTDYLFINSTGTQLSRQGYFKILKGYAKQLGLEQSVSPQVLRNSFAAHLIENGANVRAVGEMLGYSDLASAYHYVNTSHAKVMEEYKNAHPRA